MSLRKSSIWRRRLPRFQPQRSAAKFRSFRNCPRLGVETLEHRALLSGTPIQPVAPIASNDVQPTDGATPLVLDSLSYFSIVDGATLLPGSVKITTNPTHGMATVDLSTGNITYVANTGFAGTDQVGFTVTDSNGLTSGQALVNEVVSLPTATGDTASTEAGVALTIPVLANDASLAAPLAPATVVVASGPSHGGISIDTTTGNIKYTSLPTFSGTDTFTYTVADSNGVVSNPATVSVVVNRPQANDVGATTVGTTPVVINVLSKDSAPKPLVAASVTVANAPADGTAQVDPATGNITYTPNAGFSGSDAFTYTVADTSGAVSNAATVTIAVQRPSGGTVVNPITANTQAGQAVVINVLSVDSSPIGLQPGSVTVSSPAGHGTTSVNPTMGAITYTAAVGFQGTDSFTYTVKDNNGVVAGPALVSIVVSRPNANDGIGITGPGQSVVIPVLASDNDVDNQLVPSSVTIVAAPSHGTASVNPATGAVTYTANSSFAGMDTFTYTVANTNNVVSNPATVTVLANAPTANDAFGTTDSGFPITFDVLASATDPAGTAALVPGSVSIVSGPANGTAVIDPSTGIITYTSVRGFNGTDSISYRVSNNNGAVSNVGTITIVNNRPTAVPDSATTTLNTPVAINVAANDSDPDGNQFLVPGSVTIVTPPSHGSASVSNGVVTYTPSFNYVGTDTFAYTISDDHGATSNPAIDTVVVTGPQGPQATPVTATGGLHLTPIVGTPLANVAVATFTDPSGVGPFSNYSADVAWGDGTSSAGTISFNAANGTFTVSGSHTYVAPGSDPVSVTIHRQGSLDAMATSFAVVSPQQAQGTPNQVYVAAVYADLLGRPVDPAGLAAFANELNQGASRTTIAATLDHSAEYFTTNVIAPAYQAYLGRSPDPSGTTFWVSQMQQGLTDQQLEANFIGSDEFFQHAGGTNAGWVNALYQSLLGRPADAGGLSFWLGQLQSGETRSQVAMGFTSSVERAQQMISADYLTYLGRASDQGGLDYWVQQFKNGQTNEDLITGFVASDEFFKSHS